MPSVDPHPPGGRSRPETTLGDRAGPSLSLSAGEIETLRAVDSTVGGALSRAVFEQSPLGKAIYDAVGRPLLTNPSFARLWGTTLDRVNPDYRLIADPQLDRLGLLPLVHRAFLGEPVELPRLRYDMAAVTGVGRARWIEGLLYPLRDLRDVITAVVFVQTDVTPTVEAERALRAADERLQLAAEAAGLGAWEWNVVEGRVHWSETLERIHGLEPGTFDGTFDDYQRDIHPDDRDAVLATVRGTLEGDDHRLRYRIIRPDGAVRWLEARGKLLRDEHGTPSRVVGVCTDATDRVREELRAHFLAEASERLHGSLDYESTLEQIARVAVPEVADWCIVRLVAAGGRPARRIVAHRDAAEEAALRTLVERYPVRPEDEHPTTHAMRTVRARLGERRSDAELERSARGAEHLALLQRFRARSWVLAPLVVQGAAIGTLSLSADAARGAYDERDLAMVEELARRAGAAIEQAVLHASVTEAHEQLEQQALELELQAQQLQDQATELESQKEELEVLNEELVAANDGANAARLAAEAAEHHVRGILEAISDPFVVHDAEWRFRYINASAAASFRASGHAGASLVGQVVWDAYPDIVGSAFEREMRRAARERVPTSFQEFYPGSGRWVELSCYPLPDGGLATIWKDITERKRAAEAMHYFSRAGEILGSSLDHEATMAAVARLMVPEFADWCTVDLLDPEGTRRRLAVAHADPSKVEWARELERRYPTGVRATTGAPNVLRTGRSELHAEVTDEMLAAWARDAEHLEIMRSLGFSSVIIVPLTAHGRTVGVMSLVTAESRRRYTEADVWLAEELARRAALAIDNARLYREAVEARARFEAQAAELEAQSEELKDAQAELEMANDELQRANEQLVAQTALAEQSRVEAERANRAKSDFLAVMSHELRTPLNAIGGYAQLLEMGVHGPVTDPQREALARIARSQHHLLSLINDVLNFAKLEAGRVQYHVERIVVDDALSELEGLVAPQLAAKAIRFEHRPADASLAIDADADKLQQILLNLLSNAIKFTPVGGRIAVGARADGMMVYIDVEDSGEGIPRDKHETVFEPFVQLARDGRTAQEGTGLGLSISRDLARAMGGELVVESEPGAGSKFTLALPRGGAARH